MLNNKKYIQYLLWLKDSEIDENFNITNCYFRKYYIKMITKEELLDHHTTRNKLFKDWCYLYEIYIKLLS